MAVVVPRLGCAHLPRKGEKGRLQAISWLICCIRMEIRSAQATRW